jgi:hypothetical protein
VLWTFGGSAVVLGCHSCNCRSFSRLGQRWGQPSNRSAPPNSHAFVRARASRDPSNNITLASIAMFAESHDKANALNLKNFLCFKIVACPLRCPLHDNEIGMCRVPRCLFVGPLQSNSDYLDATGNTILRRDSNIYNSVEHFPTTH